MYTVPSVESVGVMNLMMDEARLNPVDKSDMSLLYLYILWNRITSERGGISKKRELRTVTIP